MNIKRTHLTGSLLLPLFALACGTSHAAARESSSDRSIQVTGTAVTRTTPDTVVWHITTTSVHRNLVRAKEESDNQMQAILTTVRDLGVKPNDLQTGFLDVSKEYEGETYDSIGDFKQFRVTRQLTIKERDTSRFDAFLTALVKSADMEVRYTLESSNLQTIQAETRLKSMAMARNKAEAMAGALDAEIGEVLTIREQPDHGYGVMKTNYLALEAQSTGGLGSDATTGTFAPGSIDVRVSVETVFELK